MLTCLCVLDCRNSSQLIAIHDGLQGHADRKAVKHGQATREEFISSKLAPKLAQQLKVATYI